MQASARSRGRYNGGGRRRVGAGLVPAPSWYTPPMDSQPPVFPQRFPGQALLLFRRDPIAYLRRAASECGDIVRIPLSRSPV